MTRFSKQAHCPPTETLAAYQHDTLPLLAEQAVAAHLGVCDFCGAELQLLARAAEAIPPAPTPPLPLALRLYAETLLAAPQSAQQRRAA
jgi:hypothetical protein